MGKDVVSPKTGLTHKKHLKRAKTKRERDDVKTMSRMILTEAKRIAHMEVQKLAMEVLSDATVIARWEKNPFYIS